MRTASKTFPDRRTALAGLAGAALLCLPGREARAADRPASPWAVGMNSRVRLSAAGRAAPDGPMVAVVEIALAKGYKTYWRTPGDSGVPPSFDFSGSENAAGIEVNFPPPLRFDDGAGGRSIGYLGPLVELPVTFRPIDPAKPSRLVLAMDYAVCAKICIPGSGKADLLIRPSAAASRDAAFLLASLPDRTPLGAAGPLVVAGLGKGGAPEHFMVEAAVPEGAKPELFVEAAAPWLFDARQPEPAGAGRMRFPVLAIDRDRAPDCKGVEVRMTLVAAGKAIETTTWLDVSLLAP
jgi:suppressor for copper-sensitivity B